METALSEFVNSDDNLKVLWGRVREYAPHARMEDVLLGVCLLISGTYPRATRALAWAWAWNNGSGTVADVEYLADAATEFADRLIFRAPPDLLSELIKWMQERNRK